MEQTEPLARAITEVRETGSAFVAGIAGRFDVEAGARYVRWSPDGALLLTSGENAVLWDAATGKQKKDLGKATRAIFTQDGTHVIANIGEGLVAWNLKTAERFALAEHQGYGMQTANIHASADGSVVVCNDGLSAYVYAKSTKATRRINAGKLGVAALNQMALSADGQTLYVGNRNGKVVVVDVATLEPVKTIDANDAALMIERITISADGKTLATATRGAGGNDVRTYDLQKSRALARHVFNAGLQDLELSPGGTLLASYREDISVLNAAGNEEWSRSTLHTGDATSVCFSPDARYLAAMNEETAQISILDTQRGGSMVKLPEIDDAYRVASLPGKDHVVVFENDGDYVAEDGKKTIDLPGDYLATSPGEDTILCLFADELKLCKLDGEVLHEFEGEFDTGCFTPDGGKIVAANGEGVTIFDPKTGNKVREFATKKSVLAVAVNKDSSLLAAGGYNGYVRLYDFETGDLESEAVAQEGNATLLRFSPDGKWLASAGRFEDPIVSLWKMGAPAPVFLEAHADAVSSICFSPDSKHLLTGGFAGMLRVWEVESASKQREFQMFQNAVQSIEPIAGEESVLIYGYEEESAVAWPCEELLPKPSTFQITRHVSPEPDPYKLVEFDGWAGKHDVYGTMAVSPDEKTLAVLNSTKGLLVYDLAGMLKAIGDDPGGSRRSLPGYLWLRHDASELYRDYHRLNRFLLRTLPDIKGDQLVFSPDSSKLLVAGVKDTGELNMYSAVNGELLKSYGKVEGAKLVASPTLGIVAVTSPKKKEIWRIDFASNDQLAAIPASEYIEAAVDDENGLLLVTEGRKCKTYDLKTGKQQRDIDLPINCQQSLSVPGRKWLVHDGGDTMCSPAAGWEVEKGFGSLMVVPGGRYVFDMRTFYDVNNGKIVCTLPESINKVHFTKDGKWMIVREFGEIKFCSLGAVFDMELQAFLKDHSELVIDDFYYDGQSTVIRSPFDGRSSAAMLSALKGLNSPVKLDLDLSIALPAEMLRRLAGSNAIRGISLTDSTEELSVDDIKSLAGLPNLTELALAAPEGKLTSALPAFEKLKVLRVKIGGVLGYDGPADVYAPIAQCKELEDVDLELWSDENARSAIEALSKLSKLRRLSITCYKVRGETLALLASLKQLEELSLTVEDFSDFSDIGSGLVKLKQIKTLRIACDNFNSEHLQQLKGLTQLESLDLAETSVSQDPTPLFSLKNLKYCRVPEYESVFKKKLQTALPDARVYD